MGKRTRKEYLEVRYLAASLIGNQFTRDRGGFFFHSFVVQQCVDAILAAPRSNDEWLALQKCSIKMQHKFTVFEKPFMATAPQQSSLISALRAHFDAMGEPRMNPEAVRIFLLRYKSPFCQLPGWVFRAIVAHLHPDPLVKMVYAGQLDNLPVQR